MDKNSPEKSKKDSKDMDRFRKQVIKTVIQSLKRLEKLNKKPSKKD